VGFWVVVVTSIAALFFWGLFWPRSQWAVLVSWSRRDQHSTEPSAAAFGVQRMISALGMLFFGAVGAINLTQYIEDQPAALPPPTAVQQMWGRSPDPQVVDRIVQPLTAPPEGLVVHKVLGYQVVDNETHTPRYLHTLRHYVLTSGFGDAGLIGVPPDPEFAALDSAEMVVNVQSSPDCIPRQAVVVESETAVQVAVYFGLPDRSDGSAPDHAACTRPSFVRSSLLLPLNLQEPLGERSVQSLDGAAVRQVPNLSR
jgi:hypothetical protein